MDIGVPGFGSRIISTPSGHGADKSTGGGDGDWSHHSQTRAESRDEYFESFEIADAVGDDSLVTDDSEEHDSVFADW